MILVFCPCWCYSFGCADASPTSKYLSLWLFFLPLLFTCLPVRQVITNNNCVDALRDLGSVGSKIYHSLAK